MATLFIIGNGFDIWNRLPTSYRKFNEVYKDQLDEHIHYSNDFCDIDSEWANFEESLGSFDEDNFHDNVTIQPSLEELGDDPKLLYGYEDEISIKKDELVDDITSAFKTWIRSVDVSNAQKLIHFELPANFVNFNYTETLQHVYRVPNDRVLHIHGSVGRDIIFGHGRNINSTTDGYEVDEPWFNETKKEIGQVLGIFHKPVEEILERNRTTLEGFENVDNIVVIGHSINEIDVPYFQCILEAYPDAEWQNYNYVNDDEGVDEVSETHYKLLSIGVSQQKLKSYSSENLKTFYPVP